MYFLNMSFVSDARKQQIIKSQLIEWEEQKLCLELKIDGALASNPDLDVSTQLDEITALSKAIVEVSKRLA